ncbi:hypothetical protein Glove_417g32 [Diversispora epigaea]|uniref:Uncharacterized protein n=1 Tax=Diversispora epigaea TaxID=1348612 RepID=A0A397GWQ1_9GLOM|nr:hypothetical protein Glove_417g32 [Diversispora epigaea]
MEWVNFPLCENDETMAAYDFEVNRSISSLPEESPINDNSHVHDNNTKTNTEKNVKTNMKKNMKTNVKTNILMSNPLRKIKNNNNSNNDNDNSNNNDDNSNNGSARRRKLSLVGSVGPKTSKTTTFETIDSPRTIQLYLHVPRQ